MTKSSRPDRSTLPRLSVGETVALLLAAGGPLFAKGIIVRRPLVVWLLQATGAERAGAQLLQRLRRRHGDGPVLLRIPFREHAVVLSSADARRVLAETPEPFQSDTSEKHATLSHFEPAGSLISRGPERAARRAFSDDVLQSGCPLHILLPRFRQVIEEEAPMLLAQAGEGLSWGAFKDAWFRIVRRCTFGDHAGGDTRLTALLIRVRSRANGAFLAPKDRVLRDRTLSSIAAALHSAEPNTLGALAKATGDRRARPEDQVAQWLFAFDAAGIATFRALAVLASDPASASQARDDAAPELPFLRACLLDTVRLWPTTPAVLRQTDRDTRWGDAIMPAGTGVLIHLPFLHRDDERLPFAHRFAPKVWLTGEGERWGLIPFSGGPGECPARNLVLLLGSLMLQSLLRESRFDMPAGEALNTSALPATFDHFSLIIRTARLRADLR
ncbi:cytochrome P450 [Sphingomonas sp. BK580]|uniref:cytochrome P450 n=1 Tax=Sphingomonas sp. BK580 TaxID=2586972 RepID=UPI00160C3E9E|nr:cytochrome P450 [Sphingomonas sp. BK580]MBB3691421.1 cytochrome P450 [Sphingomonas sp. BK580]